MCTALCCRPACRERSWLFSTNRERCLRHSSVPRIQEPEIVVTLKPGSTAATSARHATETVAGAGAAPGAPQSTVVAEVASRAPKLPSRPTPVSPAAPAAGPPSPAATPGIPGVLKALLLQAKHTAEAGMWHAAATVWRQCVAVEPSCTVALLGLGT